MSRADVLISTLFGLSRPRRRCTSASSARAVLSRIMAHDSCIALVQGPSGCGKSTLLASIGRIAQRRQIPLIRATAPALSSGRSVIDLLSAGKDPFLRNAAAILCACGLGEPALWVRRARSLSDSEQARLQLAIALARAESASTRGPRIIIADEFLSTLDRASARLVCRSIRRLMASMSHIRLILATAHDDLTSDLEPTFVVSAAGAAS